MRKQIKEAFLKEEKKQHLSERKEYANRLFEYWKKQPDIGEGLDKMMEKNPEKARNTSVILENEANHLKSLSETQISNDFQTTPENVLRVVRLGYPNSVRGEIFFDYPMVTARDSIYYLSPVYASTARGATASDTTHESTAWRYGSEIEEDVLDVSTEGTETVFTGTLASGNAIRPFSVKVMLDGKPVAVDDGSGNLTGSLLNISGTNSVTYSDGSITITFTSAPDAGTELRVQSHVDSESTTSIIKAVELQLTDYQLRARPYPLYVSWSKMAELLLGTTLDIDAEQSLIKGAGDELKKTLDFLAVQMAYRYSKQNDTTTFNADFATAGADSEVAHAQSVTKVMKQAENIIYNALNRGGMNAIVAAPDVIAFLTLHNQWSSEGQQPEIGIYKAGTLLGKPVYQAPTDIIPSGEAMGVWRNPNADGGDYSLVFGTLIPLYQTQVLEYKEGYSETGLFHFGDWVPIQKKYLVRMQFNNL